MDQDKIYRLQESVHKFRRSERRAHISSVGELLSNSTGALGTLVDNLNRIKRLSQSLKVILPEPLNQHCRVAQCENGQMVIAVDSGQWASRLRYEKLELLSYLRNHGYADIIGIDIIVNPDDFRSPGTE